MEYLKRHQRKREWPKRIAYHAGANAQIKMYGLSYARTVRSHLLEGTSGPVLLVYARC